MDNNSKFNIKNSTLKKLSKIFVAGGTGLVGSAIIKNLLEKGYTNIVANYRSRLPENSTFNTQHSTLKTNSVTWEKLDLLDSEAVADFFATVKPEFVFLAAAKVGGIVANNTYRADFIYENLQIQNNVIHQSYKSGVKKLMFLGSTCIYPKDAPQPMPEKCLLTGTLEYTNEPYAIAKIAGIKMCESYNLQYGTNYIAVMPTNLYGPNDNFDLEKSHVLPAMIARGSGTIVDVASMAALAPTPGMYYYNASKAGMAAASEALRGELRGTGVHVVTVYPGIIETDMGKAGLASYHDSKLLALQPRGTTEELARLVVKAVERKHERVIYPSTNALARHFPATTRWMMDRLTPGLKRSED